MKLMGAGLVAAAGLLICAVYAREQARRLRELEELCALLRLMKGELELRLTPLPELMRIARDSLGEPAAAFAADVESGLAALGERDFSDIWAGSAQKNFTHLEHGEAEELEKLGGVLGRYSADVQLEAIEKLAGVLEDRKRLCREAMPEKSRAAAGIVMAGCALLLIVLI